MKEKIILRSGDSLKKSLLIWLVNMEQSFDYFLKIQYLYQVNISLLSILLLLIFSFLNVADNIAMNNDCVYGYFLLLDNFVRVKFLTGL